MTPRKITYEQAIALERGQAKRRAAQRALRSEPQQEPPAPVAFVAEEHASVLCPGGILPNGRCRVCGAQRQPPSDDGV